VVEQIVITTRGQATGRLVVIAVEGIKLTGCWSHRTCGALVGLLLDLGLALPERSGV
jgi:hypothetical protein